MAERNLTEERRKLKAYVADRPSAEDGRSWLTSLNLERIEVSEWPLEVATGSGKDFLYHPLLRGGFLEDVFECFENQRVAQDVMNTISEDLPRITPLIAQRCVLSGWKSLTEYSNLNRM